MATNYYTARDAISAFFNMMDNINYDKFRQLYREAFNKLYPRKIYPFMYKHQDITTEAVMVWNRWLESGKNLQLFWKDIGYNEQKIVAEMGQLYQTYY